MVRLSLLAATGALLFATTAFTEDDVNLTTTASSGFVSSDGDVVFALNIPSDSDDELFFSLSGPTGGSWMAVGMGSNTMDDSLMFLAYTSSNRKNVTLSPRLSYGHVEPSYTSNVTIEVLAGTGISNDTMTVNARCGNCRKWQGGSIDPQSTAQNFIYASGPDNLNSDSLTEDIKRHDSYGVFTMDLTKAVGTAGVPETISNNTAGTTQTSENIDHDFSPALHGCVMIIAFVGLMPIGILILRFVNSVKWHGLHQAFSAVVALIGIAIGVYCGTMYNRSKNFNSTHQILGAVITVAMVAQFALGYMHHRIYKKTMAPTKLAPIHVWLGRVIIPAGIINAFLGFPLALNFKYDFALIGLVLLVAIIILPCLFLCWRRNLRKRLVELEAVNAGGYQAEPWASLQGRSDIHLNGM
jgi:uncharacterized membrane protein YqjE